MTRLQYPTRTYDLPDMCRGCDYRSNLCKGIQQGEDARVRVGGQEPEKILGTDLIRPSQELYLGCPKQRENRNPIREMRENARRL